MEATEAADGARGLEAISISWRKSKPLADGVRGGNEWSGVAGTELSYGVAGVRGNESRDRDSRD